MNLPSTVKRQIEYLEKRKTVYKLREAEAKEWNEPELEWKYRQQIYIIEDVIESLIYSVSQPELALRVDKASKSVAQDLTEQ